MKFESDKEEFIYYVEKSKYYKAKGDTENYKKYLSIASEILEKIEKKS